MSTGSQLLIGTDEAGYGPNLGPLVVTATAWLLPANVQPHSLWTEFHRVLTNARTSAGDRRLFVTDSKAVYSPGQGVEDLEVPVLAFLRTMKAEIESTTTLGQFLSGDEFIRSFAAEPWNTGEPLALPLDSSTEHIAEWHEALEAEMQQLGIRLAGVRSRIMFPGEFNVLTSAAGSKGVVLSEATLRLVRQLADEHPDVATAHVVCDKHGGRNRYDELIAAHFDDQFVFRTEESRERSRYRCGRLEFCFRTKAEELLPVALASMTAKYVREVLMHQFNRFWIARRPGLKPTQGYPVDARRFRNDIADLVAELGIFDDVLWRNR